MRSRRDFLKNSTGVVAACVAGGAFASLLQSCTGIKYISAAESDGKLRVSKSELEEKSFVIVKSPSMAFPVYLTKTTAPETGAASYSALLMRCTHKQCEVKPAGTILYCPCHGSEFSAAGKVLKDPASADLEKFSVSQDDQNIYIHIK